MLVSDGLRKLRAVVSAPSYRAPWRAAALVFSLLVIGFWGPLWLQRAFLTSPFLGVIILISLFSATFRLWKNYNGDLKITAFHAAKEVALFARYFCREYVFVGEENQSSEVKMRRYENRRLVRAAVMFLMVQHCVAPDYHLLWLHSVLAYRFITDVIKTTHSEATFTNASSTRVEVLLYRAIIGAKLIFSVSILTNQFVNISQVYVLVSALYFLLSQQYLEQPVTKLVEHFQWDFLEGLDQYYVRGMLGVVQMAVSFVFMVGSLVRRAPYLMLVALYTNVYLGGRELMTSAVHAALKEWLVMAQFHRATTEELSRLDDVCAICLAAMRTGRKTNCRHFFHGHCLCRCLKEKLTCPICATKLL